MIAEDSKVEFAFNGDSSPVFTETITTPHGPLIGGAFSLSVNSDPVMVYDSQTSAYDNPSIPYNVNNGALANALNNFFGTTSIGVNRRDTPEWGASWVIYFNGINVDELAYSPSDLTVSAGSLSGGVAGTFPEVAIYEDQAYSPNLVFNPIGYRFLFMEGSSASVLVKTNGVLGQCTGDCSYSILSNNP